ncbi:MAG: glutathione peroxidase [Filifactoraceae bacterium]
MSIYNFNVKAQDGTEVSLGAYKGKVILIVNSATECGFTPQYDELQDLYDQYEGKGLEILDFPCNQFGGQAPGSDEEIHSFCSLKFNITFPQFSKIDVNGESASPLYKWLTENTEFKGFDKEHPISEKLDEILGGIDSNYGKSSAIKWNFTKFLIDKNGEIVARFEPTASMDKIKEAIERVL